MRTTEHGANRFDVPTVLIVEDNLALADAVAEVLHSIGYCTLVAHDGEAVLAEVSVPYRRSSSSAMPARRWPICLMTAHSARHLLPTGEMVRFRWHTAFPSARRIRAAKPFHIPQ